VLGFDDCRRARVWDPEEIGFVRIVTTALAAAVQRQRAEHDRAEAVAREREAAAEARAAEFARANEAMQEATDALAEGGGFDEIVPTVLRIAARTLGVETAGFYEHLTEVIYLRYWLYEGRVLRPDELLALDPVGRHAVPRRLAEGFTVSAAYLGGTPLKARTHALVIDHAAGTPEPDFDAWTRTHGWELELNVPCVVGGVARAAVGLYRGAETPYTPAEVALAEAVAKQLALAMEADRLTREVRDQAVAGAVARERERAADARAAALATANVALREREALLAAAAEASRLLLESGDFWGTLPRALARIGQVAGWDRTQLLLSRCDAAGRPGHAVVAEWVAEGVRAQLGDATHEWVADAGVPELAAEVRSGRAFWITLDEMAAPTRTTFGGMDIQTTVAVPVFVDGVYAGVVGFDDCTRRRPRQAHELDALATAARVVAAAIQRERLVDEVARERERAADERAAALAAVNADLRLRDRLLTAVTESLRLLNADSSDDFDATVREALRLVGEAAAMHRVRVFLQRVDAVSGRARHDLTYEWWAPGFASRASDGLPGFADGVLAAYLAPLMAGRSLWQLPDEVPDPLGASLARVGMRSMGCVPVFVGAQYAGIVTFDDCVERRLWSQAEQDALDIAACAIGAAIHRREMEQAARTRAAELGRSNAVLSTRQRMLEAAVETSDALLAAVDVEEAIGGVLARLGAVLDADRALLIRFDPPTAYSVLGWAVVEHEWTAPGVVPQSADPGLARMNMDGYGDLVERLRAERVVQFVTDDLPAGGRAEQHATGAVSQVVITVVVDGTVWGFLGFDDCRRPRAWDAGEVGLLQVVAAALGSAIKREGLLHDRMVVERAATEERTRIAREMHDTLAQGLAGIVMQLGAARAKLGAAGAAAGAQLDRVEGLARESLAVARRSITVLRPHAPEVGEGLAAALGTAAMAARAECPAVVALGVTGAARRAPPEVEFELLRVAQAALANAAQHAHAARIAVTLDFGAGDAPALRIAVSDDGRGFDPAASRPGRFGLVGMLERAARVGAALTLVTAPGEGTEVVVVWPGGSGDAGRPAVPSTSGRRAPASVDALAGARADAPT
jgi:signal transduction histidine kinase